MTISYPLTPPSGFKSWGFGYEVSTRKTISPLTFQQKIYKHTGDRLLVNFTYPPNVRETAASVQAFLMSLDGENGTFLFGDPSVSGPLGAASGTPLVKGADQEGTSLIVDGLSHSVTNIFKAGDQFQIGNHLYFVMQDVNSNSSGEATLEVRPRLRQPSDNDPLTLSYPKGIFRLDGGQVFWTSSVETFYDFTINAIEAL